MNWKKLIKTKKFWIIAGTAVTGIGLVVSGQTESGVEILNNVVQSALEMFGM
jgi:hypothetical protein